MMLRRNERILDNIPVGSLGIIALDGCTEMGNKVNDYIVKWRHEDGHAHKMMLFSMAMKETTI